MNTLYNTDNNTLVLYLNRVFTLISETWYGIILKELHTDAAIMVAFDKSFTVINAAPEHVRVITSADDPLELLTTTYPEYLI